MIPYTVRPLDPWLGPATSPRRKSPFSATWTNTLLMLDREIRQLGGRRFVLQIDVSERWIRNDGELYARAQPASPAVRIAFESRHGPQLYPCDKFWHWQANVRAIALSLEALRKVDRYGVAGHGEQYRGWTAIEAQPTQMTADEAARVLAGYASGIDAATILTSAAVRKAAFRLAAQHTHPDAGGDPADFHRVTEARDLLARLNGAG